MKLSLRILFLLVFGLFLGQLSAAGGGEEGEEYDLVGTAMHHIAEALVRWVAPILSFTAEEIWENLPGERGDSVLLEQALQQ